MRRLSHHVEVDANEANHKELLRDMRAWAQECVQGYYAFDLTYLYGKHTKGYHTIADRTVSGIRAYFDRADDAAMFKLAWYKS